MAIQHKSTQLRKAALITYIVLLVWEFVAGLLALAIITTLFKPEVICASGEPVQDKNGNAMIQLPEGTLFKDTK